jgi:hypothetical protein
MECRASLPEGRGPILPCADDLEVKQTGEQRAMKGEFQISTCEGMPLWSGGATIGWVK